MNEAEVEQSEPVARPCLNAILRIDQLDDDISEGYSILFKRSVHDHRSHGLIHKTREIAINRKREEQKRLTRDLDTVPKRNLESIAADIQEIESKLVIDYVPSKFNPCEKNWIQNYRTRTHVQRSPVITQDLEALYAALMKEYDVTKRVIDEPKRDLLMYQCW